MVTLTWSNTPDLPDRATLSRWMRNFRRSKFWEPFGLVGGMYAVEATFNRLTRLWHPHIHAVIVTENPIPTRMVVGRDGKLRELFTLEINQGMSDLWMRVNRGAGFIVDGRAFQHGGIMELTKYTTKMDIIEALPDDRLRELFEWMQGRRLITTFGCLHGLVDEDEDEDEDLCPCGCHRGEHETDTKTYRFDFVRQRYRESSGGLKLVKMERPATQRE